MNQFQEYIDELTSKDFIKALMEHGDVHIVGGQVRDLFLGKESKDLDLLVTKITSNDIIKILEPFGRVDLVGKSFGIIKFFEHGSKEAVDIALPRLERSTGAGHKDFDVVSDPFLPIEEDLKRRDFTINSLAICLNNNKLIDPFNGERDLKINVLRVLTDQSFIDDGLRMIRGIQFCSRFNMTFENHTANLIHRDKHLIKTVAGERVLEELKKIYDKGNIEIGFLQFVKTLLYKEYFGKNFTNLQYVHKIETWFDFITVLLLDLDNPVEFYKETFHGDIITSKQINGVLFGLKNQTEDILSNRWIAYQIYQLHPDAINSGLFNDSLKDAIYHIKEMKHPWNLKQVDMNGDILLSLGYKPMQIGKILNRAVRAIIEDEIPNERNSILEYIKKNPV